MLTLGRWQFPLEGGRVELLRQRHAVLGGARGPRHRDHDRPHAGQLSAVGHGDARAERHGHARHARHLRHLHVLHVAARGVRAAERLGRDDHADRRHRRRRPRHRSKARRTPTWSRRRRRQVGVRGARRSGEVGGQDRRSATQRRCCGSASGATGCRWSCRWRRCQTCPARCGSYLKRLDPYFELYASPINIDPLEPALPISTPEDYAAELAERHRPLLHAGHARRHQGAEDRRARRRRVPGPGADHRRREPAPVSTTCSIAFTRRPALLLLRPRRPGVAHDVAGAWIRGIRPTPTADAPYRARRRGPLRRDSTASSATRRARSVPTICWW